MNQHLPSISNWFEEVTEQSRELVRRSREILNLTKPDTFLGRKAQQALPEDGDPMLRLDIQNLIDSELRPPIAQ
jgi:hypothetical protein